MCTLPAPGLLLGIRSSFFFQAEDGIRDPRGRLFCAVFDLGSGRKQNKWTAETGLTKGIFYYELHVEFRLVDSIGFFFSKDFLAGHFKKFKKIPVPTLKRPAARSFLRVRQPPLHS